MSEPGIDLNALEDETRRLLSLLKDRHPGLATWSEAFVNRQRAVVALIAPELADGLRLVLLFHQGGPWSEKKQVEWHRITGTYDATTRVMCDTLRALLARVEGAP